MIGDHVKCGNSTGIVDQVDDEASMIEVVCFQSAGREPERKSFHIDNDIVRYDYDVMFGRFVGREAVDRAGQHADHLLDGRSPYRDKNGFALWCKTGSPLTLGRASQLAVARVEDCVRKRMTSVREVRVGDHISEAFANDRQHYIVVNVDVVHNRVDVIYLQQSTTHLERVFKKDRLAFQPDKFHVYFYDSADRYPVNEVIRNAREKLVGGEEGYQLPFRDSHHFAAWCKARSFRLHCQ